VTIYRAPHPDREAATTLICAARPANWPAPVPGKTWIPNEWIRDNRLSMRDLGVLSGLLLLEAEQPWPTMAELARNSADGIDAVKASFRHLIQLGYIDPSQRPMPTRRAGARAYIPRAVRHLVYERDEYRCVHCGDTEQLSLDHIIPWALGGGDDPENLRTLCRQCNSRKGARVE
jgi:hypothetical protein